MPTRVQIECANKYCNRTLTVILSEPKNNYYSLPKRKCAICKELEKKRVPENGHWLEEQ